MTAVSRRADVIVVGLGAMGSATCLQLALRGASVIGIDRFQPPHPFGSTHGETRITRLATGEGPEYVPLVRRAHALWRELEERAGVTLMTQTGGLILARSDNAFLQRTRACAREAGIPHENLTAAEVAERFPMFAIGEGSAGRAQDAAEAYHEPAAGYVRPEAAVRVQLKLAAEHRGVTLRTGEPVRAWRADGAGVSVTTDAGSYRADRLILCAGAWIPELFPEGRSLFAVHRQLVHWFPIRQGYELLRDMPVFVWDFGEAEDAFAHFAGFYGFPAIDGPAGGVKVGTETYERTVTPDGRQHPATRRETERMHGAYLASHLPWLGAEPLRSVSCLYTNTRGSRFVIDRHPAHDSVLIVSPCSGHGFKHSPAIGEAVAQWVLGCAGGLDLSAFSLQRARAA